MLLSIGCSHSGTRSIFDSGLSSGTLSRTSGSSTLADGEKVYSGSLNISAAGFNSWKSS